MDAIAAIPVISATSTLPKSSSSMSLSSAMSSEKGADSTSPTLCEQTEPTDKETDSTYSREIALLNLSPEDLDISHALGDRTFKTIECLRINRCRMDGATFASLVDAICAYELPCLHTVDISQNRVGGAQAGAALAKLLAHAPAVRFLSLGWNQFSLGDLKDIVSFGPGTYSIQCLDLRANPLGIPCKLSKTAKSDSAGSSWVGTLIAAMPHLTHVQLAQATIDDSLLVTLLYALVSRSTSLEYIGLEWLGLGGRLATVRSIMSGLIPSDPKAPVRPLHLNLAANNLGDSGVKIITESGAVLSSLTLACNFITERGTGMLAKWLPTSGLTLLELSDNYFGDQGIASLLATDGQCTADDAPRTQLISLGLNSCCLTDTSLRMITEALAYNWAPLTSLRILRNNRMSPGAKVNL
ncbi:NACHT, LRR and PYD domains-containing protein 14 [Coemansia brasiliensis]|uniref:NACHT, LRR and PYD domains-containing protein 14 n=1 Tax=Coemansia brasiliensis TaxID=2650707 RepID=A0A9W8I631_9FUNG|nr:NACHT, LRR and PYD domains-containing protein 14 [Coemansia brasiliensis]